VSGSEGDSWGTKLQEKTSPPFTRSMHRASDKVNSRKLKKLTEVCQNPTVFDTPQSANTSYLSQCVEARSDKRRVSENGGF
jgi:hypothetical protein